MNVKVMFINRIRQCLMCIQFTHLLLRFRIENFPIKTILTGYSLVFEILCGKVIQRVYV